MEKLLLATTFLLWSGVLSILSPLCPSSHPNLEAVTAQSAEHMGGGSYLVAACCPSGHKPIYFGNEGVGCCKTKGQKCVFECNCGDGSDPLSSRVPSFINQVGSNHINMLAPENEVFVPKVAE